MFFSFLDFSWLRRFYRKSYVDVFTKSSFNHPVVRLGNSTETTALLMLVVKLTSLISIIERTA